MTGPKLYQRLGPTSDSCTLVNVFVVRCLRPGRIFSTLPTLVTLRFVHLFGLLHFFLMEHNIVVITCQCANKTVTMTTTRISQSFGMFVIICLVSRSNLSSNIWSYCFNSVYLNLLFEPIAWKGSLSQMRTTKAQVRLRIRAIWSGPSLSVYIFNII